MTTQRASTWSVTINNPTQDDEEYIALARQKGWRVDGQLEKGKEGTPHYQLVVQTGQVRFSAVKLAFPRAHIEIARNVAALQTYVRKEETRVGDLPSTSDKYPSLDKFWKLLFERSTKLNWVDMNVLFDPGAKAGFWWKDCPHKQVLMILDDLTAQLIEDGYHVETLAVNPQVRCSFDKFHRSLFRRAYADSQTDSQCVSLPTINSSTEDKHGIQEEVHHSPPGSPGTDAEEDASTDASSC